MKSATDAEPQRVASGCTSDHSAKMIPTQWAELGSKQAMASSYIAPDYMENETTIDDSVPEDPKSLQNTPLKGRRDST